MYITYNKLIILFSLLAQFEATNENNDAELTKEHLCIRKAEEYTKLVPKCRENAEIFDIIDDNILSIYKQMNDEAIQAAVSKTCSELQFELECDIIEYNQTIPCASQKYLAEMRISMTIDKVLTEFLCENNGQRVMNLIPNDGLHLIFDNDFYNSCLQQFNQLDFDQVELKQNGYYISEEYCFLLENAYNCLKQLLNTSKNLYLPEYEIELHRRLMWQLKCNIFNKTINL